MTMEDQIKRLRAAAIKAVADAPVLDIHTHLYAPAFGSLLLAGIDDLLTFHYLVAETFRRIDLPYAAYWSLSKPEQADIVWRTLFVDNAPLSEACRGVLTTLQRLGLDPQKDDLPALRRWFAGWNPSGYIDHCMQIANVQTLCMTNSPFDDEERPAWDDYRGDSRFAAALRIDPLLMDCEAALVKLAGWGYETSAGLGGKTLSEVRRFLTDWSKRMNALYVMVSLPPDFAYPDNSVRSRLITGAVLPHCREFGLPFALMPGAKRQVNPDLQLAGDGVGRSDLNPIAHLCAANPDIKFLVTALARECQHELCALARKFRNLHPFGCWWFMNVPVLIDEVTRMRMELLGTSFTAQHSDARVLDQIIYKWDHSRAIIGRVLADKYADIAAAGWVPAEGEIEREARELFGGSFRKFIGGKEVI